MTTTTNRAIPTLVILTVLAGLALASGIHIPSLGGGKAAVLPQPTAPAPSPSIGQDWVEFTSTWGSINYPATAEYRLGWTGPKQTEHPEHSPWIRRLPYKRGEPAASITTVNHNLTGGECTIVVHTTNGDAIVARGKPKYHGTDMVLTCSWNGRMPKQKS